MKNILLSVFLLPISIVAQVTIGSDLKPNKGALLDLKEHKSKNIVTASKGLLLPRVQLTAIDSLLPMFTYKDEDIPSNIDLQKHAGLTVYNINPSERDSSKCAVGIVSGLYVWNGERWNRMQKGNEKYNAERLKKADHFIDKRDDGKGYAESITYRIGYFGIAGWWMLENLRTRLTPNGKTNLTLARLPMNTYGKNYIYPSTVLGEAGNGDKELVDTRHPEFGYMYSWDAATNGKSRDGSDDSGIYRGVQGLCPDGWHLPSKQEWIDYFR